MPSSTSNSDRALRHATIALLAGLLLISISVEFSTIYIMDRHSLTQIRIDSQLPAAMKLQQGSKSARSILVIGNSLLVQGLQTDILASDLGPSYVSGPLLIESTSYYDWYYGLRHLFLQRSRPDLVVVGLSVNNLLETRVRGEYFTHTLLERRDLFKVAADIGASHTETSSMFFGTLSRFWGDRNVIRDRILDGVFPKIQVLITALTRHPRIEISDDRAVQDLRPRLMAMKQLCEQHGAQMVILLPPVSEHSDNSAAAFRLGSELGITVLQPVRSDTLELSDFSDGIHLTPQAALRFTHATAAAIRSAFPPGSKQPSSPTEKWFP